MFGNTQDGADIWESARTSGNSKGSALDVDSTKDSGANAGNDTLSPRSANAGNDTLSPRSTASGGNTRSSGTDDYYINPDDYDSDEEYAKALMAGVRDSMQNGDYEAFLAANGYAAGAEGLAALNKDIEDALGSVGVAVATDELNANDEASSTANGQSASSGAQNAQPVAAETQTTQPTQPTQTAQPVAAETQTTQPVQIQDQEPSVNTSEPEYELYGLGQAQMPVEQIQQQQRNTYLKDLERLGVDLPEGASELQYSNLGEPNSTAGLNSDDYYINTQNITDEDYAKELIKQLNYYHKQGNDDAFLTQNGYAAGEEGKQALIADVQERIGIEGLIEYWDDLMANEASNGGNGQYWTESNNIKPEQDKVFFDYIGELFTDGDEILKEVMKNATADSNVNPDVTKLEDFSEELNEVIQKCCAEYVPLEKYSVPDEAAFALVKNALVWKEGVFNHWNFVGDTLWKDDKEIGYDSYIPDEIQDKELDAQKDFFIVNGIRMNREQYGNYVKGATAQYAFPFLPASEIVNIMGVGMSIVDNIEDNIKGNDKYNFTWENEIEDSYFTYLGARDMMNGVFE